MRKSTIAPAILNRIRRDLIHNPLHLIFSVDVLGMTKSTLSSLSKGFAELSTDGQFLQLRSKQVEIPSPLLSASLLSLTIMHYFRCGQGELPVLVMVFSKELKLLHKV